MDLAQIRELLKIVAESGVAEVEIEEDDFKLTVRKSAPTVTMQQGPQPFSAYGMSGYAPPPYAVAPPPPGGGQQVPTPPPQQASAPTPGNNAAAPAAAGAAEAATPPQAEDGEEAEEEAAANKVTVKAPIVGTFYCRPSPEAEPYVEAGDEVAVGDVLCIIEAMKLMNEIESETTGIVRKILVEDGQPVEYEQPLFVIEAS